MYSCNINESRNDSLSDCSVALSFDGFEFQSIQGIAISSADGTIFLNATIPRRENYLFICGINPDNGKIDQCHTYSRAIHDEHFPRGMTYLPLIGGRGILTSSNMGLNFFGGQCIYEGNLGLPQCVNLNEQINYQFAGRTRDVAWEPEYYRYLYFTSGYEVYKWTNGTRQRPISMPSTRTPDGGPIPNYAIATF